MNPTSTREPAGAGESTASEWTQRKERGSPALMRFMVRVSLALGRGPARVLLHPIAAYFLAFSARARRFSRDFLAHALGRRPTLADQYRHFLAFAATIHDRVFFISGRFEPFDIRVVGEEAFEGLPDNAGAFLMGAHLGSFEAAARLRARAGRTAGGHGDDRGERPQAQCRALGHRSARGRGDRPAGPDGLDAQAARPSRGGRPRRRAGRPHAPVTSPTLALPFLGGRAEFPTGPMRMAAILRARVIFMTGLYRGANRYDIHFETLADFSVPEAEARGERDRLVREAIERYAARLERYAREHPFNWFNFHDFWTDRQAS